MSEPEAEDCKSCVRGFMQVRNPGMSGVQEIKCWHCKGGKVIDVKVQAERSIQQSNAAAAIARERDRLRTDADRLAFAIKHASDGVCP